MTTIAYDGKTIAVDSRRSVNGVIVSDAAEKFRIDGNRVFILCGATDECDDLAKEFEPFKKISMAVNESSGFLLENGKVFSVGVSDGIYFACDIYGHAFSDGSGGKFALAAIDMGKTAEQAVKYAMTRCAYTGGHVHVFCAKTGKKLK
jgi:hypothetical protein